MNEAPQNAKAGDATEPVAGERLAIARRERAISVHEIAKELHLDELKVRAIEENRFDDLGAPVFAKGHMRKYAELVGVSTEDVLEDYYKLNRSAAVPPVVGRKHRPPRDFNVGSWLAAGAVLIGLSGAAWWWFTRDAGEPAPQFRSVQPPVVESTPEPDIVSLPETQAVEPAELPEVEPEPAIEMTTDTERVEDAPAVFDPLPDEAPAVGPQVTVELAFSGDCWTEITDAGGRRLFYDLGTAGRVVSLRGAAPLRVVLGDSENVSIVVDGRDYTIAPSARRGRLARLTIDGQE